MNYIISLDWFQYFCHAKVGMRLQAGEFYQGKTANSSGKCPIYEVKPAQEFHSIYRYSVTMCLKGYPIAHVHWCPKSSALDPHSCAVKVANRLLYSSTWSFHLHDVCQALELDIKSITRVDLCCDFVRFANGMLPTDFIHHYLRDTLDADTETYIRRGSNKFCAIGKKKMLSADGSTKITDDTEIESVVSAFDYLRFGTRQSGCSVYLYNKSLELREKKGKPWIRRSWVDAGLIKEKYAESELEPDVYRLELSIQAKGMNVRAKQLGDHNFMDAEVVRKLVASDFNTQLALEDTFWSYQARYFSFKIATGQKYRKDMKELQLFEPEVAPTLKPTYLNRETDSGRAELNAASCIRRLKNKTSMLTNDQAVILLQASDILESIGIIKKSDTVHDLSFCLDPEKERCATADQRRYLEKCVEYRLADLMQCFQDPEVAQAVEHWEYLQGEFHDTQLHLKDAPDYMCPQPAVTSRKVERERIKALRKQKLYECRDFKKC